MELTLADRYVGVDPVDWNGTVVYPLYSQPLQPDPTVITLRLHAVALPPGLLGLGMGLSVMGGFVTLEGQRLGGVDVWSDAMAKGADLLVQATEPNASFTVTPVWMHTDGTVASWTGNYGVVLDRTASGHPLLYCSAGVGPVNFTDLVVEVTSYTAPNDQRRYGSALHELGVAMNSRGELDQACALWEQAASMGHAGAAYELGLVCYRRGDLGQTQRWWRMAAEAGDARARAGLAEVSR